MLLPRWSVRGHLTLSWIVAVLRLLGHCLRKDSLQDMLSLAKSLSRVLGFRDWYYAEPERLSSAQNKHDSMPKVISNSETQMPELDASVARQLVNQSIAANRELASQHTELRESLAVKFSAEVLAHIAKVAQRGNTQAEYFMRDRWVPVEHRDEVVQLVKNSLDHRGFNILTYWQYSLLGSGTVFQIEW